MADPAASRALQNAITARHADAFLANMALGEDRTYSGANMRDAAMADNIKWILEREERIVIGAANGHIQRWPYRVPPIIKDELTMLGQHLAALGVDYVPIATTFNGGRMFLHRPIPGGEPGHTEVFYDDLAVREPERPGHLDGERRPPPCSAGPPQDPRGRSDGAANGRDRQHHDRPTPSTGQPDESLRRGDPRGQGDPVAHVHLKVRRYASGGTPTVRLKCRRKVAAVPIPAAAAMASRLSSVGLQQLLGAPDPLGQQPLQRRGAGS